MKVDIVASGSSARRAEVVNSTFDYFSPIPVQNARSDEFDVELYPLTAISDTGPLEFLFNGAPHLYINLAKSVLMLEVKITKAGAALEAEDVVGPCNNILHTMWASSDLYLNGTRVSDHNGCYPYRAIIEDLLRFPADVQETQLRLQHFNKDTAGKLTDLRATSDNKGYLSRLAAFKTSATVQLLGRPHHDLFHQHRSILPRTPIKLVLTRAADPFALLAPSVDPMPQFKLQLVAAKLYLRAHVVTGGVIMTHEEELQTQNCKYPIGYVQMKTLTIPSGLSSFSNEIYSGALPDRVVIMLIDQRDVAGSYQRNPFNFQHFGLNHLALNVNGDLVPRSAFQPNFAKSQIAREYQNLFDTMNSWLTGSTINISPEEFMGGYAIFPFNLNPDRLMSTIDGKTGNIRLDMKFAAAPTEAIHVILYAEYSTFLEIDQNRNIIQHIP